MVRSIAVCVTAAILLSACATGGELGKQALSAAVTAGKARLVIYRSNPMGGLIQPNYLVDGRPVGASKPNGFVACELAPGKHNISVANTSLNVNLGGGTDKAEVDLLPGTTTYIRATPSFGLTVGVITLSPTSAAQGAIDTESLHKLKSTCGA